MTTLTQEQQQAAVELLREIVSVPGWADRIRKGEYICQCNYCGRYREISGLLTHAANCPVARARALLAAIESEATE
jgi:hypothetical protein